MAGGDPTQRARANFKPAMATLRRERLDSKQAATLAEIVILTVRARATCQHWRHKQCAYRREAWCDATAPLVPPRVNRVQLPQGGSAVAAIQALLGDRVRVVSAFQNVSAEKLKALDGTVDCDVLVCADDAARRARPSSSLSMTWVCAVSMRARSCNSAAAEALTCGPDLDQPEIQACPVPASGSPDCALRTAGRGICRPRPGGELLQR